MRRFVFMALVATAAAAYLNEFSSSSDFVMEPTNCTALMGALDVLNGLQQNDAFWNYTTEITANVMDSAIFDGIGGISTVAVMSGCDMRSTTSTA